MKQFREDLYRLRFLLPCTLAAVLLLRWAAIRGRPERLADLAIGPMTQWAGIVRGAAITFGASDDNLDLVAHMTPIEGGHTRQIVRHPSSLTEIGAFVSEGYLYYVNVWYRGDASGATSGASLLTPGSAGRALAAPGLGGPATPLTQRPGILGFAGPGFRNRVSSRIKTTFHRVPLAGGPPEEIKLDTTPDPPVFANVAVVGGRVFWTRRIPLPPLPAPPTNGKVPVAVPTAARYELMVTPVAGGAAKRLFSGEYQGGRLFITERAAYLSLATAEQTPKSHLISADAASLRVRHNKDVRIELTSPPITYQGRIYWVYDPAFSGGATGVAGDIMERLLVSAAPDGSDTRVELSFDSGEQADIRLSRLYLDRGKLYATAAEVVRSDSMERRFRHALYEVHPGDDVVLKKLTGLPKRLSERGVMDGGYYYFLVNEPQENPFDFTSDPGSRPDRYMLYRWKLPG